MTLRQCVFNAVIFVLLVLTGGLSQSWMLQKYALGLTVLSITRLSRVVYTGAQLVY